MGRENSIDGERIANIILKKFLVSKEQNKNSIEIKQVTGRNERPHWDLPVVGLVRVYEYFLLPLESMKEIVRSDSVAFIAPTNHKHKNNNYN